ncbi:alpha/beta hydrolase [Rhodococcus fascians]|nr:alpha/beta hydrolase [Rhodococcus fascians]
MKTVAELRDYAQSIGPAAPLDTEYVGVPEFWQEEYKRYDVRTAELVQEFDHFHDLRYGSDPRHIIDVYLPKKKLENAPVFVFFHGGALVDGHPRQYGFLARSFLEKGAIFVCPGYRLMPATLAAERAALEADGTVFVHELGEDAPDAFTRTRQAGADAAVTAATDARAAIAWIHHNIAAFGGRPDRLVVGGHSAGAMLTVATGCGAGWQTGLGIPEDVITGIVPIGGRYGLWQGNAIISGRDAADPPHEWQLGRAPSAAVVFGEEEYDGDGKDDPKRFGDCARIGRTLIAALREKGADVTEVALPPCGHWDTVQSIGIGTSAAFAAVSELMGIAK